MAHALEVLNSLADAGYATLPRQCQMDPPQRSWNSSGGWSSRRESARSGRDWRERDNKLQAATPGPASTPRTSSVWAPIPPRDLLPQDPRMTRRISDPPRAQPTAAITREEMGHWRQP
ncbi:hypothetical protein J4Q44_G00337370 [Coregonus suidteri]|uniref:Uncharacterized protein n=1 Tax=Coregonus suidteri TaxID=861788 RepID=A0AAN8KVC4_9TELE